jgi:Golgi SNAP receptor complex protein 1
MATWDNARRHARALETALDSKLSAYSRSAAAIARPGGQSSTEVENEGLEEAIEELLSKVCATYNNGADP